MLSVFSDFRLRASREQPRLQGGWLQTRDCRSRWLHFESTLSRFVPGQKGLRLDILNHSRTPD